MLRLAQGMYPGGAGLQEFRVRNVEDDRVVGVGLRFVFGRRDLIFAFGYGDIDPWVLDVDLGVVGDEFAHEVDRFVVAQLTAG